MATKMIERSTYWVNTNGSNPAADGDYRYYWIIYYETDKVNRKTNFTVNYYLQTHCTNYTENSLHPSTKSGTSDVKINGKSIGTYSTPETTISKGASWSLKYLTTKTFPISHNNDGSAQFTFQGSGFGIGTALSTYSTANGDFPSIPSQSKLGEIKTFDIDKGISSIGITKYVDGYYDVLQISNGNNIFKTINGFENNDPVTFTETELNNIYAKIPTGKDAVFTFKLTTYTNSGKTTIVGTDTKTATGNFTIALPTVRGAICTDNKVGTENYTGDTTKQTIINNISLVHVEIPTSMEAIANTRGATIVEYIIEGKHVVYNKAGTSITLRDEDADGNMIENPIYTSKDYVIIYAVDSRGTSSLPYTQKFTNYIDYSPVKIDGKKWNIVRDDNGVSRKITVSFEGTWWQGNFGIVENKLRTEVYYRNAEDGYWTDPNEFVDGAEIGNLDETLLDTSTQNVFKYNGPMYSAEDDKGFDIEISYDTIIAIYDELSNRVLMITVEYGEPAIAVYKNKAALGGPYDEYLGGTQIWKDLYINGEKFETSSIQKHIVSAYLEYNWTNDFTAWTSYVIPFDTSTVIGDKLVFEDGAVTIGEGVSKIRMSGSVYFSGDVSDTQLRMWTRVKRADGSEFGIPSYGYAPTAGTNMLIATPPVIANVVAGDRIEVIAQIGKTATDTILARGTTIYVEVIE